MTIDIKNIHYAYHDTDFILKNINHNFGGNQFISLIGPNGSGKSTLLKVMCGLGKPRKGHVFFNGKNIEHITAYELSQKRSYFSQFFPEYIQITIDDLLDLVFDKTIDKVSFNKYKSELLTKLDLAQDKYKRISDLSGGQQQRVYIARACLQAKMHTPSNYSLFFDEPLNNLDIKYKFLVMNFLKEMVNEGYTVIVVIHDINLAAQFSDKLCLMKNGSIVQYGPVSETIKEDIIQNLFDQPIDLIPYKDQKIIHYKNHYDYTV